jgi:hypothetical protein
MEYTGSCEIAVINSGKMRNKHLDKFLFTAGRDPYGFTEVYNVLWIVRRRGFAYRKGIGAVLRSFWESEETELTTSSITLL